SASADPGRFAGSVAVGGGTLVAGMVGSVGFPAIVCGETGASTVEGLAAGPEPVELPEPPEMPEPVGPGPAPGMGSAAFGVRATGVDQGGRVVATMAREHRDTRGEQGDGDQRRESGPGRVAPGRGRGELHDRLLARCRALVGRLHR